MTLNTILAMSDPVLRSFMRSSLIRALCARHPAHPCKGNAHLKCDGDSGSLCKATHTLRCQQQRPDGAAVTRMHSGMKRHAFQVVMLQMDGA